MHAGCGTVDLCVDLPRQVLPAVPSSIAEPLLEPVARLVRDCMEGLTTVSSLCVPLRVRLASGPSWGELQDVQLD